LTLNLQKKKGQFKQNKICKFLHDIQFQVFLTIKILFLEIVIHFLSTLLQFLESTVELNMKILIKIYIF